MASSAKSCHSLSNIHIKSSLAVPWHITPCHASSSYAVIWPNPLSNIHGKSDFEVPCYVTPWHASLDHVFIWPNPLSNIHDKLNKTELCHVMSRHSVLTSFYPPPLKSSKADQTGMSRHVTPHSVLHSLYIQPLINHPRQTKPSLLISWHVMSRLTRSCIVFISSLLSIIQG